MKSVFFIHFFWEQILFDFLSVIFVGSLLTEFVISLPVFDTVLFWLYIRTPGTRHTSSSRPPKNRPSPIQHPFFWQVVSKFKFGKVGRWNSLTEWILGGKSRKREYLNEESWGRARCKRLDPLVTVSKLGKFDQRLFYHKFKSKGAGRGVIALIHRQGSCLGVDVPQLPIISK